MMMILVAVLAAYANSFSGDFVFDDPASIVDNPTIRQLWPLGHCSTPCAWSPGLNQQVHARPLLNFSFAINYALGGLNVWGYHALNVAIHICNALLLFIILLRTLMLPALRARFGTATLPISLIVAVLWSVHPLQTESVTYIVQRAESLVALFYLLTLYCVIRGAAARVPAAWYAAAVFACQLGMTTKEVMVTAPVVVFLYDGIFLAGSFRQALLLRRWLYSGFVLGWVLLAYLVVSTGELFNLYASNAVPKENLGSWSYAATQTGVILHYLRLVLWPDPLVLDYDWPLAKSIGEVLPAAVAIGLLLATTLWGVLARKPWGFLGAWFFLILSPTSSVVPLEDFVFEHRMYLPLAAVLTVLILGGYMGVRIAAGRGGALRQAIPTIGVATVVLIATILAILAFQRNKAYANPLLIWQDTVLKAPGKPRVHLNLGHALAQAGKTEEAIRHYREALRLRHTYPEAHNNLGIALAELGRLDEAIGHYMEAQRLSPDYAEAYNNLGIVLARMRKPDEAIANYKKAIQLQPGFAEAHSNFGNALAMTGQVASAIGHYQDALRADPRFSKAHYNLGVALTILGRTEEAISHYEMALRLKPDYLDAHLNLARARAAKGQTDRAIWHYREALRLKPVNAEAHKNLGNALAATGEHDKAIAHYREAVRLMPDNAEAHNNLGVMLIGKGGVEKAAEHFRQALRINPDYGDARTNLEKLKTLEKQKR